MDISVRTYQGGRKYMEDFHFICENFMGEKDLLFAGIFDGHGGKQVAQLASLVIPDSVMGFVSSGDCDEKEAIRRAFKDVSNRPEFQYVGSTALCFLASRSQVLVANCGDSRIFLVSGDGRAEALNSLHNTGNADENERILCHKGEIEGSYYYRRNSMHGIGISRALGDLVYHEFGLIDQPEFRTKKFESLPCYLVAGSDGVWDNIGIDEVSKIVHNTASTELASQRILEKILNGKDEDDINFMDNITLIVVRIT